MLLHGQPSNGPAVLDKIEDFYKRAVHADPANANNFSNYGLFLAEVRGDNQIHFIYSYTCTGITNLIPGTLVGVGYYTAYTCWDWLIHTLHAYTRVD